MALDPIFGDPKFKDQIEKCQVKGSLVASRPRYIAAHRGEPMVKALAEQLTGSAKVFLLEPPLVSSWLPIAPLMQIDRLLIEKLMNNDVTQVEGFGSEIAGYDLSTLYKLIYKMGTPSFIMKHSNMAFQTYFRGAGELESQIPDAKKATIRLRNGVLPLYLCRYGVLGWIRMGLEKSGGLNVAISETECIHNGFPMCRWDATWS